MRHKKTGLVLGKFIPLHKGHELLLNFANNFVDILYVVVDHLPDSPMSGELRCQWIKQSVPDANVFYLQKPHPQHPDEHPDFWNIWRDSLLSLLPQAPDYVFASDEYGGMLAKVLSGTFIPFDLQRQIIPISGTAIRKAPLANWEYLSAGAKQFYLKRICIFGPESTGKTTLARLLAEHYHTQWVPEYARLYIESKHKLNKEDMLLIAKGQISLVNAMLPLANKILFCDTDPLSTLLWNRWLFHEDSTAISTIAAKDVFDLYLLTRPDITWQEDPIRYFPGRSDEFFNDCVDLLTHHQKKFIIISGSGPARLASAIKQLDEYFSCLE